MGNPKTHKRIKQHTRYEISVDGSPMIVPGVTTIVGQLNKPALVNWANKLGLEGINVGKFTDELADIGTVAHEYIRCKLQGLEFDEKDFTPNQIECAKTCCVKFDKWYKENNVVPILVEEGLVSTKYRYGGTLDLYGTINGIPTLLDWKTGSGFYEEHKIQLSANKSLLEEKGYKVEQCMLVGIGRNENEDIHINVVGGMDLRFEKFKHLLGIWWINKKLGV